MKRFEIGKTYTIRSVCDHDCIFSFVVTKRTEKMVTIKSYNGEVARKVRVFENVETLEPLGRYSMAPILTAERAAYDHRNAHKPQDGNGLGCS